MCHAFIVCYSYRMAPPTSANPRRNFVTLRFTDDEVAALDAHARATGMSRSDTVRSALSPLLTPPPKPRTSKRGSRS